MRTTGGTSGKNGVMRRFLRAPVLSAVCVLASVMLAPTMVRAFSNNGMDLPVSLAARGALGSFTPSSVDRRLVAQVSLRAIAHGKLFRFTPASLDNRPDRSVTVAVRLSDSRRVLMATRGLATETGPGLANPGLATVRITPVAYSLGTARGYQSFALPAPGPFHDLSGDGNELNTFSLAATGKNTVPAKDAAARESVGGTPRLAASVVIDERAVPGITPRTMGTQGDYQVRMGGRYRLIGNLDVTAGVRVSSDRDRLRPLTDHRQDSQAIYVGTQFHF